MAKSHKAKKKIEAQQVEPGIKRSGWFVVILGAAGLVICLYLYSFHIDLLMGYVHFLHVQEHHRSEGFIELEQVDVCFAHAGLLQY